jgi:hypothetical protein
LLSATTEVTEQTMCGYAPGTFRNRIRLRAG